jgi:hypothetical protein
LEAPHNEFLSSLLLLHPLRSKTRLSNTMSVFFFSHDRPSFTPICNKRRNYNFVYVRLFVLDSKWEGKSSGLNGSRNSSELIYLNFSGHANVIC